MMKRAIVLSLLSFLVVLISCANLTAQNGRSAGGGERFADWCRDQANLSSEVQQTVEVLLAEADTQDCDQAEAVLTNWDRLQLFGSVTDLSPLASLTNLTELTLENTAVADLLPLANLTNLTRLQLRNNQITDLSPLADLTQLTWLSLKDNNITDLSPLASLTNLTWFEFGNSEITDL
ncbi:leucine-rich repeat domain-containing protein [Vacuolonema iberomarrocanum]|uniref:leucine-rich repeat domain-containing protein n=1 Tax=Vacuolonema iberomarrocanum TaxID=3454632 RepID=UPI001A100C6C|nr:leucine-rich repeat domain-containing protein [filamentous cyanobacterium LEGE 07170]